MKISIITATYNSGSTVRDTMESVLAQSYGDWEHIIVDGASKDNTVNVIQELEPKYNGRLKWISEPDKGIYDAMNKGIALASGDVIGILNSDDFYTSPGILSKVAIEMLDDDIDAVYGDIHFVDDADLTRCVRYYSSRFFHPWMMKLGYQPAHPSFYCRKKHYDNYGSFDLRFKIAADFEHMLRLIYVNRIHTRYIPLDFVTMRTGGASTNGLESHRRILKDHYRAYRKHSIPIGFLTDLVRYPLKLIEILSMRFSSNNKSHNQN
ncbi:MAG: glycosyltransferase [Bacteroides sp.]|nr:glycosyltransferase [Bacteroides sp.]